MNLKNTIDMHYKNEKKVYIVSILKSKDYKTIIRLLCEDNNGVFIFTSGNDENRYVSKKDLFDEASKFLSDNIYMCDLKEAIVTAKARCEKEAIFAIRKFLCIW